MKIFITGFMGSGKSHWGRVWADKHGMRFFDLDKEIEFSAGKTIQEIFSAAGEEHFREIETSCLRAFQNKDNFILSCGGGAACFNDNMNWMNAQGLTIFLSVPPAVLVQRIMDDTTDRPLIKEKDPAKLIAFVDELLAVREPFYFGAQIILHEETLTKNSLNDLIVQS